MEANNGAHERKIGNEKIIFNSQTKRKFSRSKKQQGWQKNPIIEFLDTRDTFLFSNFSDIFSRSITQYYKIWVTSML